MEGVGDRMGEEERELEGVKDESEEAKRKHHDRSSLEQDQLDGNEKSG